MKTKKVSLVLSLALFFSCAAVVPQFPVGTLSAWDGSFTWTGEPGATWYLLEVYTDPGNVRVYRQWHDMSCADCSVSIDTLTPGSYWWQVMDYGAYGYGQWSAPLSFSFETFGAVPPPVEWVVPDNGTFAEAMLAMTDCGTVTITADIAEPAISYGDYRSASYIVPDYGCDWTITGVGNPIVTYDPDSFPMYYDGPGVVFLIKNSGTTIIDGLHFIGTRSLGDNVNPDGSPVDKDITVLLDAPGSLEFRNNEIEQSGHAGLKHNYAAGLFLIENNRFHDNGDPTWDNPQRNHHMYMPGGGQYTIRNNKAWNGTGWCVGYGNVSETTNAQIYGNTCLGGAGGVSLGIGANADARDNLVIGAARGLWLEGGGNVLTNNVFLNSTVVDVYSERSCGAIVTNWCADPVPNLFYGRGNIYDTISHPDRIE